MSCRVTSKSRRVSESFANGGGSRMREISSQSSTESIQDPSSIDVSHLASQMTSRHLPTLHDYAYPTPFHLLSLSLSDFIPQTPISSISTTSSYLHKSTIPPSHHLVYFPPLTPISSLLPDGTDPLHSPGGPFTRRMWAGGSMAFNNPLHISEQRIICDEHISDVTVKGRPGEEKIFVQISRQISYSSNPYTSIIDETRSLVFMRDHLPSNPQSTSKRTKILNPNHPPDYTHTFVPSASLLFRFSALTFNAHRIHLDKEYCRTVEGHRNLLVHGPMTVVLMLDCLRSELEKKDAHESIKALEYRNLAPVYAEEQMKICGRKKREDGLWEVWVEGGDGGVKVRGVVRTGRIE